MATSTGKTKTASKKPSEKPNGKAKEKPEPCERLKKALDQIENSTELNSPRPMPASAELKRSRHAQVEVEWMDRRLIKNAPYNPRTMSASAKILLRQSIQKHKMLEPFIWNKRTGNLVGGHQRIDTIDQLEGKSAYLIPVNPIDVDPKTEVSLNIALNNPQMQGEYDAAKVIDLLREDKFDLDLTGFGRIDLEQMGWQAGLQSEFLESVFSDTARETLSGLATEIDSVMDQSDVLRKKESEKQRNSQSVVSAVEQVPQESSVDDHDSDFDSKDAGGDADGDGDSAVNDSDENHTSAARAAELAKIKAARGPTDNMKAAAETDYMITFAFKGNAQKRFLAKQIGIGEFAKLADGDLLAKLLGIELPE